MKSVAVPKANCWEIMNCGREVGGRLVNEQGICPAATCVTCAGANEGVHGGRLCWAVAGTFCSGEVHGSFASKSSTCTGCEVFKRVQEEEGPSFRLVMPRQGASPGMIEQFVSIMSILDAINGVVYVADLDTYELLFVNPYAAKLFGDGILGKPCYAALQAGQTGPCAFCTNNRLLIDGEPGPPVVWEFKNTRTDRWFMCIDKAMRWADGRLVRMEVAIDITDRKATEQFRDEYVGLISHDLRNPLNSLSLEAQFARRMLLKKGLTEEAKSLDGVLASARRMNTLITDLVDTTRLEAGQVELEKKPLDLADWIAETAPRVVAPEARARLVLDRDDVPAVAMADANRLERVLENLVANALKYSGEAPVTISVRRQGTEGVVSVRDAGVGVAAAELPKLFQRFYRVPSAQSDISGTGLGLYNARLLVEAHGGRVWAESELGHGSEFHFALPLVSSDANG